MLASTSEFPLPSTLHRRPFMRPHRRPSCTSPRLCTEFRTALPPIVIGWHGNRYWDGRRYWARDDWYRHNRGRGHWDHGDRGHNGWH